MDAKKKKIILGCALGCGGVIVLGVALIVSFYLWLNQPGELLEPGRLVGDDTLGYAEWTLRLEDPGTERFVEDLLDELQRGQADALEALPSGPLGMFAQWQQRRDRKKLRELFPIVAVWTLSRDEDPHRRHHLMSVSIEKLGNTLVLADWIMALAVPSSDDELVQIRHEDEVLYHSPEALAGLTFFLRGNDIFFTYDLETARRAVDRLQSRAPEARPPTPVDELFARIPEDRSFRAVLTNENGEIFEMWQRFALRPGDPEALQRTAAELRSMTVSGGLKGDETFEGEISLRCPDEAWAKSYLEMSLQRFREGLAFEGLELGADATVEGDWIVIRFRVEGALSPLEGLFAGAVGGAIKLPKDVSEE